MFQKLNGKNKGMQPALDEVSCASTEQLSVVTLLSSLQIKKVTTFEESEEIERLKVEVVKANQKYDQFKELCQGAFSKMSSIESALQKTKEALVATIEKRNLYKDNLHDVINQYKELHEEHAEASGKFNVLHGRHAETLNKHNELHGEHAATMNRYKELHMEHEETTNRYKDLLAEHEETMNRFNELQGDHSEAMKKYNELHRAHAEAKNKFDALHGEHVKALDTIAALEAELQILADENVALEAETGNLEEQKKELLQIRKKAKEQILVADGLLYSSESTNEMLMSVYECSEERIVTLERKLELAKHEAGTIMGIGRTMSIASYVMRSQNTQNLSTKNN